MGQKIIEAIIENGQIKYTNKKLPDRRIKVHILYDSVDKSIQEKAVLKLVAETSAIYKDIDAESEAKQLRIGWERDAAN